jgi:hypothetical protein
MKYITILDLTGCTILEGAINDDDKIEDILKKNKLKESQCSYMITDDHPPIKYAIKR